jgi:hypothetical protein
MSRLGSELETRSEQKMKSCFVFEATDVPFHSNRKAHRRSRLFKLTTPPQKQRLEHASNLTIPSDQAVCSASRMNAYPWFPSQTKRIAILSSRQLERLPDLRMQKL